MKKLIISFSVALFSFISLNAQIFVGGGFNFSTTGGYTKAAGTSVDKEKVTSFSFEPKAGYMLSEDLYFGMQVMFGTEKTTQDNGDYDKSSEFGFAPFARYYAFRLNKFSVFGQGIVGLSFGSSESKNAGTTADGPKSTSFGFAIYPGIAYELSDKIELEAYISGFNFGYSSYTEKEDIAGTTITDKTSHFGFGVSTDNILTTGTVNIGFIFKL